MERAKGNLQKEPAQPPQRGQALEFERVARLFGAVEALLERIDGSLDISDRDLYERSVAVVRSLLDEAAFAGAWQHGRAMGVEQIVAYALGET